MVKYLKWIKDEDVDSEQMQTVLNDLHKSFASLTQEEQKYANIFLHDVQSGNITIEANKTFREYITEYKSNAKNDEIKKVSNILGLDEDKLRDMMSSGKSIPQFKVNIRTANLLREFIINGGFEI